LTSRLLNRSPLPRSLKTFVAQSEREILWYVLMIGEMVLVMVLVMV
jgi:hypothetical protein